MSHVKKCGDFLPHETHSWGVFALQVFFEKLGVAPINPVSLLFKVRVKVIRTARLLGCEKLQDPSGGQTVSLPDNFT
eukprot:3584455-Rhodomonas_salina.2